MADPAYFSLRKMLLDEITPVVMVLPTPLVEQRCQKNGLSFVQMLTPFSVFNNIDVPVRTASDQPYRLQKFKLRMFYASDIRQPNIEVTKKRLEQVIADAGNNEDSELYLDPSSLEARSTSSEPEFVPTWFQHFNKELVRSVSFSDHEAFDHPVACLLVVSSNDEDPISKFMDLFNKNQLPPLLNDGAMDPKIPKYYVLVHDNQDGSPERATKILAEMRNTFGSNDCRLLCINSSQGQSVDHQPNPWDPYGSNASPGQHLGCLLNNEDMDELRNFVRDLSSKDIIPNMEQRIRVLNQQVSATRKGFRNQIKNLWWRKGKEDTPEVQSVNMYTFNSIESQIRVLGDYAFMLRDYELALSNYRLLSTDYKLDKAWKRYAGVQEMMGLTYFMLNQSKKDAEYCMENAFTTYLRIGTSGKGNATRCGLWWVEMLKTSSQYKDAAGVYFRISGEVMEPLHSAVMLEQASYCYLLAKPSMLRKYGFHLILSGDLYNKCDQIKHAIRAYRNALSVFKGTTWSHIHDHVHYQIGKWYAFLGRFDVAMKHMLEILACSHQSNAMQELFMRDFFQILEKTGKTYNISRLQLPIVNISSLSIVSEDHRTYGSPAAVSVKESVWQSLEEEMVPSLSNAKTTWLDLQSKLLPTKLKQSNVCVAGEALKVEISFRNPLQLSIPIYNVTLMCEYSENETPPDANSSSSVNQGVEDGKKATGRESNSDTSLFTLSKVDITLEGGETTVAQLSVIPRKEGLLRVTGVSWKLSDSMVGFYTFDPDLITKKLSKQKRKAKQNANKLEFLVIKSLPRLEGAINNLPSTVYAGNLHRLSLELRNSSEIPVKNLKMKISHPRFLNIGNPEVLDVNFPSCLEKKQSYAHKDADLDVTKQSETVFHFPKDVVINNGTPFLLPLWFRAATPGNVSLYLTIYYEIEDKSTTMRYRTLRTNHMLEVLPSLDVSFFINPSSSRLQEYVVRMDIINRTSLRNFKLHQLSSVGNEWKISLIESLNHIFPSGILVPGQALTCFLKLKNVKTSETDTETDVWLGDVSNEAVFDTQRAPLVNFHHYERLHQKTAHQENQSTVDFMLISRMEESENVPSDVPTPPQIFSHHACHCSVSTKRPIWWLLDGPRVNHYSFSNSFCETKLKMTIHNSSSFVASVRINTFDSPPGGSPSGNKIGWHDMSTPPSLDDATGGRKLLESVPPFIWSGSSTTRVKLEPNATTEISLLVTTFAPGTYDLSNYTLNWNLLDSSDSEEKEGVCYGRPFYLTILGEE
ncbi:trafficking protein particle complex subunit 8 isoform X1 [Helianthus annuus]|uniref:trafficking protein particle complex subunit 8 isoform X1 n=1 Tax=Helianthus annuus TaxID=4232 RepID=UPI000B904507|nr:trafficking protein particle complex subunit 8 isoform X1 [Helianthus annuus]